MFRFTLAVGFILVVIGGLGIAGPWLLGQSGDRESNQNNRSENLTWVDPSIPGAIDSQLGSESSREVPLAAGPTPQVFAKRVDRIVVAGIALPLCLGLALLACGFLGLPAGESSGDRQANGRILILIAATLGGGLMLLLSLERFSELADGWASVTSRGTWQLLISSVLCFALASFSLRHRWTPSA